LDGASGLKEGTRSLCEVFVIKPEGNGRLGKHRCIGEDGFKIGVKLML